MKLKFIFFLFLCIMHNFVKTMERKGFPQQSKQPSRARLSELIKRPAAFPKSAVSKSPMATTPVRPGVQPSTIGQDLPRTTPVWVNPAIAPISSPFSGMPQTESSATGGSEQPQPIMSTIAPSKADIIGQEPYEISPSEEPIIPEEESEIYEFPFAQQTSIEKSSGILPFIEGDPYEIDDLKRRMKGARQRKLVIEGEVEGTSEKPQLCRVPHSSRTPTPRPSILVEPFQELQPVILKPQKSSRSRIKSDLRQQRKEYLQQLTALEKLQLQKDEEEQKKLEDETLQYRTQISQPLSIAAESARVKQQSRRFALPKGAQLPEPLTTPKPLTEPARAVIEPMDIEWIELGGVEPYISQEEIEQKLRSDLIKLNNKLQQLYSMIYNV